MLDQQRPPIVGFYRAFSLHLLDAVSPTAHRLWYVLATLAHGEGIVQGDVASVLKSLGFSEANSFIKELLQEDFLRSMPCPDDDPGITCYVVSPQGLHVDPSRQERHRQHWEAAARSGEESR